MTEIGYHFCPHDMRETRGKRRHIHVGKTLTEEGGLVWCEKGMHFSREPKDALRWAPDSSQADGGWMLCRVEVDGVGEYRDGKGVAHSRKVLKVRGAEETIRRMHEEYADPSHSHTHGYSYPHAPAYLEMLNKALKELVA